MKFIIALLISFVASAQVETINCVILIDGKLIDNLCENSLIFKDESGLNNTIHFGYEVGQLMFKLEDLQKLQEIDKNTLVTINFNYCNFEFNESKEIYSTKQELDNIINQRYIIFRIFNCRNCDEYRVYTESPKYHNPLPKMRNSRKLIRCSKS